MIVETIFYVLYNQENLRWQSVMCGDDEHAYMHNHPLGCHWFNRRGRDIRTGDTPSGWLCGYEAPSSSVSTISQ